MPHTIRPMSPLDLPAVLCVQAACYPPAMQEPGAVVAQRLDAASATCVVACDGDGVCGYLFAYPSRLGSITALGAPFAPAADAGTLYLHDLAVAPRAAGRSLARALVEAVLGRWPGDAALVAVQDSARFWHALGFRAHATDAAELTTYPAGALYMVRMRA